jgi:hypothetical protein
LGEVEAVVVEDAEESAVEDDGKAHEPSRGGAPLIPGAAVRRN